jgi:predicted enzyme related to lactoylglutathione lyase
VPDLPRATEFYEAVLGWRISDMGEEFGHYSLATVTGRNAAGIGPVMAEGQPSVWTLYFATDDSAATAKLVTENGGALVVEPMAVPGQGTMTIAVDPAGSAFGLWEAGDMHGAAVYNEPGGLCWEDGRSTDVARGKEFYSSVLGFAYQALPGEPMDYETFHLGGGDPLGGYGGMFGAPEGTPAHWLVYFAVADTDSTVEAVRAGGGTVVSGPEDSPFGRLATVADPFGATFAVIQMPVE